MATRTNTATTYPAIVAAHIALQGEGTFIAKEARKGNMASAVWSATLGLTGSWLSADRARDAFEMDAAYAAVEAEQAAWSACA